MNAPESRDSDGPRWKYCPGGCQSQIDESLVCCDACWVRIPTNVPGQDRWRTARRKAITIHAWARCEDATEAAKVWLLAHPVIKSA